MYEEDERFTLYMAGKSLVMSFCSLNSIAAPKFVTVDRKDWRFGKTCAYYRPTAITTCVQACARPGLQGRSWSWPGYSVDRTPYGVVAHELGHHVDFTQSSVRDRYRGDFSVNMRRETREEKLTNYCPDDGEWFAEMFRLYVTNPHYLSLIRPKTCDALDARFQRVVLKTWDQAMPNVTERHLNAARNKINQERK